MISITQRCPLCGQNAEYENDILDGYILCEEYVNCKHCGYFYSYQYGYTFEYINGKQFYYSYHTLSCHPVFKRIKRAIFMHKRNLKKNKLSYHKIIKSRKRGVNL